MNNRLSVIVLSSWYPNPIVPLSGVFIEEQARLLSQKADVSVLFIHRISPKLFLKFLFSSKSLVEQDGNLTVYTQRVPSFERISARLDTLIVKHAARRLYNQYRKSHGKPDVIHAHLSYPGGVCGCMLGQREGIPVAVTEHMSYLERFLTGGFEKELRFAFAGADRYFAVSKSLAERLSSYGLKRCDVLPNFLDENQFQNSVPERFDGFTVLCVAAMDDNKHMDRLVLAFDELINHRGMNDVRLVLVGDGPERENLLALVREKHLESAVKFTGVVEHEKLGNILAGADVLAIVSDRETFGMTGIEAMSLGKPVIATRCGGPEDYITPENGLLIEPGDINALADAILHIKNNRSAYNADAIKAFVKENYGRDAVVNKTLEQYRDMIQEYKNRGEGLA